MEKNYSDNFLRFTRSLPADIQLLRLLLSQYEELQKQLLFLINNPCPIICIHYLELQPELLLNKHRKVFFYGDWTSNKLIDFLENYANQVCGERMMVEEYIELLELEKNQTQYN